MAIKYGVKFSQADVLYGKIYEFAGFLDDSYTDGLAVATLLGYKGDGTTSFKSGTSVTYQEASSTDLVVANAVVFRDSQDPVGGETQYQKIQNYGSTPLMYPYGGREARPMVPLKEFTIVIEDSDNDYFFNTVDTQLTGTVEVLIGDLTAVVGTGTVFTTELAEGDLIKIGNEVREVVTISDNLNLVVGEAFAGAIAALTDISQASDMDRPIYLADNGGITKVTPTTSGALKQEVGRVVNGNNVHCNLNLDKGTVIA